MQELECKVTGSTVLTIHRVPKQVGRGKVLSPAWILYPWIKKDKIIMELIALWRKANRVNHSGIAHWILFHQTAGT